MDKFYKALEDRFRGTKEDIKEKLKVYLPLIGNIDKTKKILDIGCGRGEFLELLYENGYKNLYGVDINDKMTKEIKYDIKVYIEDGIQFLKKQQTSSYSIITSFHMVEHIEFDKVLEFIKEAFRVLDKEGILIIETPNPENLKVASESFYLDYTHIRPIPMDLLKFAVEYMGFSAKILRLNSKNIGNTIKDVIERVSPDYAIIGYKCSIADIEEGVSLDLAEYAFELRIKDIEDRLAKVEIESKSKLLEYENDKLREENNKLKQENNKLKQENNHYKSLYEEVINSKSWKITRPLREIVAFLKNKRIKQKIKNSSNQQPPLPLSKRAKEIYEALKKEIK